MCETEKVKNVYSGKKESKRWYWQRRIKERLHSKTNQEVQNFLRKHFFQRPLSIQLFISTMQPIIADPTSVPVLIFHGDFLHTGNARTFRKLIYLDKNIILAVIFEEILAFCKEKAERMTKYTFWSPILHQFTWADRD